MSVLSWSESYGEEIFKGFNMSQLKRDEAYLNISSTLSTRSYLYSTYKECYKCLYTQKAVVSDHTTLTVDTAYQALWRVMLSNSSTSSYNTKDKVLCNFEPDFGEFGVYNLAITEEGCELGTVKEPVNIYFSILPVMLICLCVFVFIRSAFVVWNIYKKKWSSPIGQNIEKSKESKRLKSLDTFRGLSIILMIFVNYGSGGYVVLDHTTWNGLHLADVVFPWFIWIMGVCIPISISSAVSKGIKKSYIFKNIIRRSCILFLLGLFLGAGLYLDQLRIFGVLQRFAVCYFITASITLLFITDLTKSYEIESYSNPVMDILVIKYHWIAAVLLIGIHTLLAFTFEVPNCPRGYLGPGGYHEDGQHFECTGGVSGYIDKLILGNRGYAWTTTHKIYNCNIFEPEGILGFLTSIVQVITGIQAGTTIIFYKKHSERIFRWLLWGIVLGLIGAALCQFSIEGGLIPINKYLWSGV